MFSESSGLGETQAADQECRSLGRSIQCKVPWRVVDALRAKTATSPIQQPRNPCRCPRKSTRLWRLRLTTETFGDCR